MDQRSQQYFAGVREAYNPKIEALLADLKAAGEKFKLSQLALKKEWAAFMRAACNAQPGDVLELSDGRRVLLVVLVPEEHLLPGGIRLRTFYPLVHALQEDGTWSKELSRYRYTSLPFKVVGHEEVPGEGTLEERMANAIPDIVETPKPVPLADKTVESRPTKKATAKKKTPTKKKAAAKKRAPAKKKATKKATKKAATQKTTAKKPATKKKATKKAVAKKRAKKAAHGHSKNKTKRKAPKSDL